MESHFRWDNTEGKETYRGNLDGEEGQNRILRAKLGIATTINRDKGRYRIRVKSESMDRVVRLIASFVIPSMLYKLPL